MIIPLLIFALTFLVFSPTIKYGLVMDDLQWWDRTKKQGFTKLRNIKSIDHIRGAFEQRFYSGTTFGTNTKVEHAFTIFLHALTCCLIYWTFGANETSSFAAILYLLHPMNNQTSIWLNGRRYAINIILLLVMMLWKPWGFMIYPFTWTLQVTTVFAPILWPQPLLTLPLFALFGVLGYSHLKGKIETRILTLTNGEMVKWNSKRLIVIVKSYGFYFFKMMIPGPCAMIYPDMFYWDKTTEGNKEAYAIDNKFYKGILALGITGGTFFLVPDSCRVYVLFAFLSTIQWCNILPIVQLFADRYMGVPLVFFCYVMSLGITHLPEELKIISFSLMAMYYFVGIRCVMKMYKDIVSFYEYHISYFPQLPEPRATYISSLLETGNIEIAQGQIRDGLVFIPHDYQILIYAAIVSLLRARVEMCETFLIEAENHLYLGHEESQLEEIGSMRVQLAVLKSVLNKK